jgi:hypothetical protein
MALLKISGLWPTKSGKGWSGRCGNTRVVVMPVDKSKPGLSAKAPDYELLIGPIDETKPLTPLPPLLEGQTIEDVEAMRRTTGRPSYPPEPPDWFDKR